jgi:hypothetical protein
MTFDFTGDDIGKHVKIISIPDTSEAEARVRVGDVGRIWAFNDDGTLAVIELARFRMWFSVDQYEIVEDERG